MLVLIVGPPKSGKTVSALTFPKPLLYVGLEPEGIESIYNATSPNGGLIVPTSESNKVDVIPIIRSTRADLHLKTPTKDDFAGTTKPAYCKGGYDAIIKWNTTINSLDEKGIPDQSLIANPRKRAIHGGPYRTLVIDSVTSMFRYLKEAILWANNVPRLRIADYGTLEGNVFGQLIPDMQRMLQQGHFDWVIIVVHEERYQDEDSKKTYEQPVGPSHAQGAQLSKEFSECYRQIAKGGKYTWRTKPHGFFEGAGSRLDLPDNIDANFKALAKVLPASMKHLL